MLTILDKYAPARNLHRFYALHVMPNLFGEWSLIRSWGRIGTSGQQRIDWHGSQAAAEQARDRLLHAKQRRGYAAIVTESS